MALRFLIQSIPAAASTLLLIALAASPVGAQSAGTPGAGRTVTVPGGVYTKGTADGFPFEGPPQLTTVAPLRVGRYPVTVAEFARFVAATGYRTGSEREGWGGVFVVGAGWQAVSGANWRFPAGPDRAAALGEHPVTQVSWADARAYAAWVGGRLPTEAEWEYFARGGVEGRLYFWGDELSPADGPRMNYWQGAFPGEDRGEDGFVGVSPVGSFPPNGFGIHDVAGNVWELTADQWGTDPVSGVPLVAMRGGSWLCNEEFCRGYRVAARNRTAADSGLNNLGFRVVFDVEEPVALGGGDAAAPAANDAATSEALTQPPGCCAVAAKGTQAVTAK